MTRPPMESCEYRQDLSDAKLRELLELPLAERAGALPIWSSAAPINAQVQARGYAQQKIIYMETDEALPPVLPSLPTTTTTTSRRRRARRPRGLPGLLQLFPYMHHARCSAAPFAHGLEGSRPQPKLITTLHYNQNKQNLGSPHRALTYEHARLPGA